MTEPNHLRLVVDNSRKRRQVAFRQADVTCAVRGAANAGLRVSGIKIGADGAIEILTAESVVVSSDAFAEWKAKRDASRSQGRR